MNELIARLESARQAARALRSSSGEKRAQVLLKARELLLAGEKEVLEANARDLAALATTKPDATAAFKDRLTIDSSRLKDMAESLRQVAGLPDPVGEIVERRRLDNGLETRRVRSPLGVIFMIFESRPNVALEAFSLAHRSGNVIILRGGKESMRTTGVFYKILRQALASQGLPEACLWGIENPDRAITEFLLKQPKWIDIVVPRGGEGLIDYVVKNSRIPIIKNDRGLCHVYVHEDADLNMAEAIVANSKCQRPGVCNAMETLLVHQKVGPAFWSSLASKLQGVEIHGDERVMKLLQGKANVVPAKPGDFDTEWLDLKMNAKVVDSLEEAIAHIERHGSRHSESIITRSEAAARKFQDEIDAAAVYWNAATRFTDGFAMGLGGELGISTQKLHVRGPVGLRELTSVRWIVDGKGQVRE
jgi:glutamate-5-semialdehyde dehydrogenase